MSKSSELDKTVKAYIISCIDASGYDVPEPKTDAEKVQFLKDTFYSEHGWNVPRVGETNALKEWFSGLPSSCNIEFYNHKIVELGIQWNSIPANYTESQADKIINNWFNLLANKTAQLFRTHCKEDQ